MTVYTVQLAYAAYYSHETVVEAGSLAAALDKAVEQANAGSAWSSTDWCGPTFVEAVAEGDDVDLWRDDGVRKLPIPSRFTENGEGPQVIVTVSGGVVQHVEVRHGTARVEVRDYDTEGCDPNDPDLKTDDTGGRFVLADWSNLIPADEAG